MKQHLKTFLNAIKPKFLFATAEPPKLKAYVGRVVVIPQFVQMGGEKIKIGDKKVVIERIVGSLVKPTFYEINGEHLIGILRFHAQMEGDKSITEQQFEEFEDMEMVVERRAKK